MCESRFQPLIYFWCGISTHFPGQFFWRGNGVSASSQSWVDRSIPNLGERRPIVGCQKFNWFSDMLLRLQSRGPQRHLRGKLRTFYPYSVKHRKAIGDICESERSTLIGAPGRCFRFFICLYVSKSELVKDDSGRKSRPNFGLFDPCRNQGRCERNVRATSTCRTQPLVV